MFQRLFFTAFALFFCGFLAAQDISLPGGMNYEDGTNLNVLYRNDASARVFAATRGYGISFKRGKHITGMKRLFYELETQNLKHPKEIKLEGNSTERRRFVYGKKNSVLLLRGAVGMQNVVFRKGDVKAVEVRYSYSLGPTLAIAKPYYVQVERILGSNHTVSDIVVFDDSDFLNAQAIMVTGRGKFTEGLTELKFYPAVTAKFNFSFEYAPYTNLIRAFEIGCSLDYFPKALPIMARNPAESFVFTFNVGFVFGKKWY